MQLLPLEEIVKLQPKGLITIPKKIRQKIGLEENSLLRIRQEGKKLTIEPIRIISYPVRSYTKKEIEEFLAFDAKQTKELRKNSCLK